MSTLPEGLRLRNIKTRPQSAAAASNPPRGGSQQAEEEKAQEEEEPVSPTGRLFLYKGFYTVILCALEFEQRMPLQLLRDTLADSLAQHPRFRSRVVDPRGTPELGTGRLFWEPVPLDISQHVFEAELLDSEAADPATAVERYMGRLASFPPLDTTRPLWEAHLLHAPRPKSQSACVLRIHHALGDGTSLMSLLLACTRQTSNPSLLPSLTRTAEAAAAAGAARVENAAQPLLSSAGEGPIDAAAAAAAVSPSSAGGPPLEGGAASGAAKPHMASEGSSETPSSMACKEGMHPPPLANTTSSSSSRHQGKKKGMAFRVKRALTVAYNTVRHVSRFLAVVTFMPDTQTVLKAGPDFQSSAKTVSCTGDISLEDIRRIRKATGATVNDIMMTMLALALEKYLEKRQEGSSGQKKLRKLPKHPRVTGAGLVNLRESPGLQEISVLMEEGFKSKGGRKRTPWGNYMGTYLLPLPMSPGLQSGTKAADDRQRNHPLEALKTVKEMCDSKKLSLEAHWTYLNGEIIMALAGPKAAGFLLGRLTSQTTLSVSNMLGPTEPVSLGGNPVTAISPTVPPPNHALCCHFQSYNGELKAVIYASAANVPNPSVLCDCFLEAFNDLKDAVL